MIPNRSALPSNRENDEGKANVTTTIDDQQDEEYEDSSDESQKPSQIPQVYLLSDIETLVDDTEAGSLVALDIDETLIMTRHTPSELLKRPGVKAFQTYVHHKFSDFKTKNFHCRRLQNALKDKVTVTPTTALAVRALQDKGCFVFGVTARYREMAPMTERTLFNAGINLSLNSPFSRQAMVNPSNDTLCQNGIIYCSSRDKGHILGTWLWAMLFRDRPEQRTGESKAFVQKVKTNEWEVPEMLFVDNVYENAQSVHLALSKFFDIKQLQIPISCYHYVPAYVVEDEKMEALNEDIKDKVLQKQMEELCENGTILSNQATFDLLGLSDYMKKINI